MCKDVARLHEFVGWALWSDLFDHEHSGAVGVGCTCVLLNEGANSETSQLVKGFVLEHALQSPAGHWEAFLDEGKRAQDPIERDEKTGCCLFFPTLSRRRKSRGFLAADTEEHNLLTRHTSIHGDSVSVNIQHGATGRSARGSRRCLIVETVEIVVLSDSYFKFLDFRRKKQQQQRQQRNPNFFYFTVKGRRTIHARERARKDRELFRRVISDDTDIHSHPGKSWGERDFGELCVADLVHVKLEKAEIVNGVAVDGPYRHLFVLHTEQELA